MLRGIFALKWLRRAHIVTGFRRSQNPATRCGHEKRVTPRKKKLHVSRAKWTFFARRRRRRGVVATTEFQRMRRILGVNGPILAHFRQKFASHFMAFAPQKTCFSASGMGNFRRGSFSDGISSIMTTSLQHPRLTTEGRNILPPPSLSEGFF